MIRINQLKLPLEYEKEKLLQKAAKILGISPADILKIDIIKAVSYTHLDVYKRQEPVSRVIHFTDSSGYYGKK